jgi:hypothetical protein
VRRKPGIRAKRLSGRGGQLRDRDVRAEGDFLAPAVLEDLEVRGGQVGDVAAGLVGDDRVHLDKRERNAHDGGRRRGRRLRSRSDEDEAQDGRREPARSVHCGHPIKPPDLEPRAAWRNAVPHPAMAYERAVPPAADERELKAAL